MAFMSVHHDPVEMSPVMRSTDRVFKLEILDDKLPKSSTGLVDKRLFAEGEDTNRLRAVMEPSGLWKLKYDKGAVPPPLQGMYTGFKQACDHARQYFLTRNIRIVEIKD
jgi:hypothetical protein